MAAPKTGFPFLFVTSLSHFFLLPEDVFGSTFSQIGKCFFEIDTTESGLVTLEQIEQVFQRRGFAEIEELRINFSKVAHQRETYHHFSVLFFHFDLTAEST